jgi:hypothetical protein
MCVPAFPALEEIDMLKTYVTVLSGTTRDWEGMLPLIPAGYQFRRLGAKLVVVSSHVTLNNHPDMEAGTAVQHIQVEVLG